MKKVFLSLVAMAIVAGAYWLSKQYFAEQEADAEFRPPREPIPVEVALATRQSIRETITYPGSVAADETVSITPRVMGRIVAINVDFGDQVNAGDDLVEIDDAEYVERLKQAQANLALAEANLRKSDTALELAQRDYDRISQLATSGVSMLQQVDTALAARDSAIADLAVSKAELQRMTAALEEAQLNLADTKIKSPLAGWVETRHLDPGSLATPSTPVLTVVDMDPAEVVVYVPEAELGLADVGRPAYVKIRSEAELFEGRVSRVAPSLSITTRTTEVIVDVPNPGRRLRPGMSTDVTLVAQEVDDALVAPAKAIVFTQGRTEVFCVENGMAKAYPVETGIESGEMIEIKSGIREGDRVIVLGQYLVQDGQPVNVISGDAPVESSSVALTPRNES